jgi:hypothetical protein
MFLVVRNRVACSEPGRDPAGYPRGMPYITRNAEGTIAGLLREAPSAGAEFLAVDHPDVTAFLGSGDAFDRLDAEFVRVIEDVIDALIVKNVINITDLPEQAQAKLFARKSFRERITKHSLRLFSDSSMGDVIGDTQLGGLR